MKKRQELLRTARGVLEAPKINGRNASEREIARSHRMGWHKLADLRALAEQHG